MEQVVDILRLLLLHPLQELLGLLRGEVRDDVHHLVRRHLLDDVGGLLLVHLGQVRLSSCSASAAVSVSSFSKKHP